MESVDKLIKEVVMDGFDVAAFATMSKLKEWCADTSKRILFVCSKAFASELAQYVQDEGPKLTRIIILADDAQDPELLKLKEDYPDEIYSIEDRATNMQIELNGLHQWLYSESVKDGPMRPK